MRSKFLDASKDELAVILAIVDFKPLPSHKLDFLMLWMDGEATAGNVHHLIEWLEHD